MIEYLEVTMTAAGSKKTRKTWKAMGCRCLRKAWAEPWTERGFWYTYHLMDCPVAVKVMA